MKVSTTWAIASAMMMWCAVGSAQAEAPRDADSNGSRTSGPLQEITVTAQRLELLGTAQTASEGVVTDEELQMLPAYRPGQLLESVAWLIVTSHSGGGKANQYLMRG